MCWKILSWIQVCWLIIDVNIFLKKDTYCWIFNFKHVMYMYINEWVTKNDKDIEK